MFCTHIYWLLMIIFIASTVKYCQSIDSPFLLSFFTRNATSFSPRVDFINVLRTRFSYENAFLYMVTFWRKKIFCTKNAGIKRWWNWLQGSISSTYARCFFANKMRCIYWLMVFDKWRTYAAKFGTVIWQISELTVLAKLNGKLLSITVHRQLFA